jgi:hypothetical protein
MALVAAESQSMSETTKLAGVSNYSVWRFRVKNILQKEDLWAVVEPPPLAPGTVVPIETADQAVARVRREQKALSIICLSVRDEVIPNIVNEVSPVDCWRKLTALYENRSTSRKILLKNKLSSLRMAEDGQVAQFLQQVQEVINQLASIGEVVSDTDLVTMVLNSLPESWDGLASSLVYRAQIPTFTEVSGLMLQEELRREIKGLKKAEHKGLFAHAANNSNQHGDRHNQGRGRSNRGGRSSGHSSFVARQTNIRQDTTRLEGCCNFCGAPSHYMRNCPELSTEIKKREAARSAKKVTANVQRSASITIWTTTKRKNTHLNRKKKNWRRQSSIST